jgi:hypothetical protein
MDGDTSGDISLKIIEYRNRASRTRRSHYIASAKADENNFRLGIPVVIITAVVGTSIFATLQENPSIYIKIAAGILSLSATILAALQTYLGFSEKSAKHKEAGARYAAIWRRLDLLDLELKNSGEAFRQCAIDELKKIVAALDEAAKESLSVPDWAYDIAAAELDNTVAAPNKS